MTLDNVTRGVKKEPDRIFLIGPPKIGKTTFMAEAGAIVIPTESGVGEIDCEAFPKAKTFNEALEAVQYLIDNDTGHTCVGIDTITGLELMLDTEVSKENGWKSIDQPKFGMGKKLELPRWKELIALLEELQDKRDVDVILTIHDKLKTFNNPEGENYSSYEAALAPSASALFENWAKAIIFASHEEYVKDGKAIRSGNRILKTSHSNGYTAGNRYNLPATIPFSWEDYVTNREKYRSKSLAEMHEEAAELLEKVTDADTLEKVKAALSSAKMNQRKFRKHLDRLKEITNG